jgi:lantibiotic modifying enzyme
MTHTDLQDAITAITGLSGATSYSLAIYELRHNPKPLRLALEALTEHVTNANTALDDLEQRTDVATIHELHPEDTPA